jgi:transcription elongation factor GreA
MYYLTQTKKDELEKELDYLVNVRRAELSDELKEAYDDGDKIAENNNVMILKRVREKLEIRIDHLKDVLKDSEIVKDKKYDKVEVGATVFIQKKGKSEEKVFQIVGREEFDLKSKKIPLDSPLAVAMMGKVAGEKFEFITPNKKKNIYTINKII